MLMTSGIGVIQQRLLSNAKQS